MFLVTYTMTYEEVNALEACRTSRDMLKVTYAWCSSGGGGVAYIKRWGCSGARERNFQLSDIDVNGTTFVFPQVTLNFNQHHLGLISGCVSGQRLCLPNLGGICRATPSLSLPVFVPTEQRWLGCRHVYTTGLASPQLYTSPRQCWCFGPLLMLPEWCGGVSHRAFSL